MARPHENESRPLHPDRDRARIEANRAAVLSGMPEMVPVIKDLLAAGLIDGWRNVVYVGPVRPEPPGTVRAADMNFETPLQILNRVKRDANHR